MDLRTRTRVYVEPFYGSRFHALLPLGNRAVLEYDVVFLGRKGFSYSDVMTMPSSRRHRLVKLHEEIDRQQAAEQKARSRRRR